MNIQVANSMGKGITFGYSTNEDIIEKSRLNGIAVYVYKPVAR